MQSIEERRTKQREYYQNNIDKMRERDRQRNSTKERKEYAKNRYNPEKRKEYYNKNIDKHRELGIKYYHEKKIPLQQYLSDKQCLHCGKKEKLCFHHLDPSTKEFDVGQLCWKRPWETILKEINKCIILCRSCHAKEHSRHYRLINGIFNTYKRIKNIDKLGDGYIEDILKWMESL